MDATYSFGEMAAIIAGAGGIGAVCMGAFAWMMTYFGK